MNKQFTFWVLLSLFFSFAAQAQQNTITTSVFFDSDKATILEVEQEKIQTLIAQLNNIASYELDIKAYTDEQGSKEYNQQLAEKRANAVMGILSLAQIKYKTLQINALGELEGGEENTKKTNRRVDIVATVFTLNNVAELQQKLSESQLQSFDFVQSKDTTFTSKGNITISVPANCLTFADGSLPKGKIKLSVMEALRPSDWIINNLSTLSNGALLETGGMLKIAAFSEDKPLVIKPNKALMVSVPTKKLDPEMQLFDGEHNDDQQMNWRLNEQKRIKKSKGKASDFYTTLAQRLEENYYTIPFNVETVNPKLAEYPFSLSNLQAAALPKFRIIEIVTKPIMTYEKPVLSIMSKPKTINVWYSKKKEKQLQEIHNQKVAKRNKIKQIVYEENLLTYEKEVVCYDSAMLYFQKIDKKNAPLIAENKQKVQQYSKDLAMSLTHELVNFKLKKIKVLSDSTACWEDFGQYSFHMNQRVLENKITALCLKKYGLDEFKFILPNLKTVVNDSIMSNSKKATWLKNQTHKFIASNLKDGGLLNNISNYTFAVTGFNWINIDKFMNIPEEQKVMVSIDSKPNAQVYLLFNKSGSIVPLSGKDNKYVSPPIPKGREATIVALKIEHGKPQLCLQPFTIPNEPSNFNLTDFKTLTIEELQTALAALN